MGKSRPAAKRPRRRWRPLYLSRRSSAGAPFPASGWTLSMLPRSPRQKIIELTLSSAKTFPSRKSSTALKATIRDFPSLDCGRPKKQSPKPAELDTRLGGLSRIEISHDDNGRPTCEFGSISISHAGEIAIAVCVTKPALSAEAVPGERVGAATAASVEILPPQPAAAGAGPRISRGLMAALGLSVMVNILLAAAVLRTFYF